VALAQTTPRPFPGASPAAGGLSTPSAFPFPSRPAGFPAPASSLLAPPANTNAPPPREIPLVVKKFEQLSDQTVSEDGRKALDLNPTKWRHAETDNFVLHFRRVTEAQKVVREVEYDLWYVATALGATRDRYSKKSHIYIFEDEVEWKKFLDVSDTPMKWSASFARGDELFLNIRGSGNSGFGASFDSHTLAHETTHAVVARLYPRQRWPLWLNEGFAEYMGGASVAARKGQTPRGYERNLRRAEMPVEKLVTLNAYPSDDLERIQLYQSSEKFIRFLMTELPKDRILKFIDAIVAGSPVQSAFVTVYGDKIKDWDSFEKRYEHFSK